MLAIQRPPSHKQDRCTLNILPCRIHHNGPTKVTKRYWNPVSADSNKTQTSYFRGRKLCGRVVKIADGYEGVVAESTDRYLPQPLKPTSVPTYTTIDDDLEIEDADDEEGEDDDEPSEPVRLLQQVSTFSQVVVWGHDAVPDADDSFVKGVQDWIAFAHALHGDQTAGEKTDGGEKKNHKV